MAFISQYLTYFGLYQIYFAITFLGLGLLAFITIYCRYKGPSELLSNLCFWLSIVIAAILCFIVFYSDHFWISLVIYAFTILIINALAFPALRASLADKSGMGVLMFSMMVSMFLLIGCMMIKGLHQLYHFVF